MKAELEEEWDAMSQIHLDGLVVSPNEGVQPDPSYDFYSCPPADSAACWLVSEANIVSKPSLERGFLIHRIMLTYSK